MFMAGVVFCVAGCSQDPGEDLRSRLYGVWRTDAAQYRKAALEIQPDRIRFRRIDGTLEENTIVDMALTGRDDIGATLRITYRGPTGDESVLDLLLVTGKEETFLLFANQNHLIWKKSDRAL